MKYIQFYKSISIFVNSACLFAGETKDIKFFKSISICLKLCVFAGTTKYIQFLKIYFHFFKLCVCLQERFNFKNLFQFFKTVCVCRSRNTFNFTNLFHLLKLCVFLQERRNIRFMHELRRLFALLLASNKKYVDPSKPVDILKEAFSSPSGATDSQQVRLGSSDRSFMGSLYNHFMRLSFYPIADLVFCGWTH